MLSDDNELDLGDQMMEGSRDNFSDLNMDNNDEDDAAQILKTPSAML